MHVAGVRDDPCGAVRWTPTRWSFDTERRFQYRKVSIQTAQCYVHYMMILLDTNRRITLTLKLHISNTYSNINGL